MTLPKAILFDLDDTLIAAHGAPEAAWADVALEFSDELHPFRDELVAAILLQAAEYWSDPERARRARLDIDKARRAIVGNAFSRLGLDRRPVQQHDLVERLATRFAQYRNERMHLFDDAHQVLDDVRRLGWRIGLVTNGAAAAQRAKIARFELGSRVDHIQIEGEAGYGKPDPRAYLTTLAALDTEPDRAWMVGDNFEADVAGPQRVGILGCWYNPEGLPRPTGAREPFRTIARLSDLLSG